MTWILLALLLIVVLAVPFVREARKPVMSQHARQDAPGALANLSEGVTHYRWQGPQDGPVLVCIHGLTTPSYVWDDIAPALAEAGFRVLSYDLYGRGYSDKLAGRQDRVFFLRQLNELLAHQSVGEPVMLLGYSMGGSIATAFAAAHPDRVSRLLLLAPAGMAHTPGGLASFARKVPVLGDWLMLAFGGRALVQGVGSPGASAELVASLRQRQEKEIGFRGYLPAVLSSQRHMLARPMETDHRNLASTGLAVAAIWGALDSVIPIGAKDLLVAWNPQAQQVVIDGAGHGLVYSHPVEVLDALGHTLTAA